MNPIDQYFDQVILISLLRRRDRSENCAAQFLKFGIRNIKVFPGYDLPGDENRGCTQSHRSVMGLIVYHRWRRTLILEDDFHIRHEDFNERFAAMIGEVPADWEMLYLGGHYAEKPQSSVSPHVIRIGRMMTTSSYAVTLEFARRMAPYMDGHGPIDTLYYDTHLTRPCYIFQPRLMIQSNGFSEIQQREMNNGPCMEDTNHENMV